MRKFEVYKDVLMGPGSRVYLLDVVEAENSDLALEKALTDNGLSIYVNDIYNGRISRGYDGNMFYTKEI